MQLPINYWETRLQARVHDPFEKALVLMRQPGGHEAGSVANIRDALKAAGLADADMDTVKRADHWASAADRLPWPKNFKKRYGDSKHFFKNAQLKHPMSGATYDLKRIDSSVEELIDHSSQVLGGLIVRDDQGNIDARLTGLAFWRFSARLAPEGLGELWRLLPADTRIPDHTIWQHLDLTAALSGAMISDDNDTPALLTMSIGPVQGFIAQARKTADLWAGSHLLSQLALEAALFIAQELGPEQLVFPSIKGVPAVDLWVKEQLQDANFVLKEKLMNDDRKHTVLRTGIDDLQIAALPNRLLVIVPASKSAEIATAIEKHLQQWLKHAGTEALNSLLHEVVSRDDKGRAFAEQQMRRQIGHLLEFHWSAVPWSLAGDGKTLDQEKLARALEPFYPRGTERPGFTGTDLAKGLEKFSNKKLDPQYFWQPNPGVAYAAIYDITNRALASAKSMKKVSTHVEQGFRCSLCGEREILALEEAELHRTRGQRRNDRGLWQRVAQDSSRRVKNERGESLCGVCTLKRLWPEVWRDRLKEDKNIPVENDFIVSTHVMAATPRLVNLAKSGNYEPELDAKGEHDRYSLPLALYRLAHQHDASHRVMQDIAAAENPDHPDHDPAIDDGMYYGILLFDGDRMGKWLSGDKNTHTRLAALFHNDIRKDATDIAAKEETKLLTELLGSARAVTPSLHASISATLNDFAIDIVPELINRHFFGQLIYAGGDDVLAMLPHDRLLHAAHAIRECWSGIEQPGPLADAAHKSKVGSVIKKRGFVLLERRKRILRTMGERATGSAGLVLVPAKMPLSRALDAVREAEQRAKNAGRDRFSISVVKRSGGTLQWTGCWHTKQETDKYGDEKSSDEAPLVNDMQTLLELIDTIANDPRVSPRFGFQLQSWIRQLQMPWHDRDGKISDSFISMLANSIAWQLKRQGLKETRLRDLPKRVAKMICEQSDPLESLQHLLGVVEFFVRKHREAQIAGGNPNTPGVPADDTAQKVGG